MDIPMFLNVTPKIRVWVDGSTINESNIGSFKRRVRFFWRWNENCFSFWLLCENGGPDSGLLLLLGGGKITPDRIARLDAVGFEWDPQKAQWDKMFERLKEYYDEMGHCKVPKVCHI